MSGLSIILWAVGCAEEKGDPAPADTGACADCGEETAPPDTAPPEETGDSSAPEETGDSADTGDTGDTGEPEPEPCTAATFTALDGAVTDMTDVFTKGDYYTFTEPGDLTFCPGEWYVRMVVEADLTVTGLGKTPDETVLSGGDQGTVISMVGATGSLVEVRITNVTIERGSALGAGNYAVGGGIRCKDFGVLTIAGALVRNNKAYDGGGLYARNCVTTITSSDFIANSGQDDGGAASFYEGDATFQDVLFQGNTGRDGAAILSYYGTVDVSDSVFEENSATYYGGAIGNYYGTTLVENSTFLSNYAEYNGGALSVYGSGSINGSRFEGNSVKTGGGGGYGGTGGAIYYGGSYGGGGSALEGEACDFVDNDPDDIAAASKPGDYLGKGADFFCSGSTCTVD